MECDGNCGVGILVVRRVVGCGMGLGAGFGHEEHRYHVVGIEEGLLGLKGADY